MSDTKTTERLAQRGFFTADLHSGNGELHWRITAEGRKALADSKK